MGQQTSTYAPPGASTAMATSSFTAMATQFGGGNQAPLSTTEELRGAIQKLDANKLARVLDSGVSVNDILDRQGHTAMDFFAREHQARLKECLKYNGDAHTKTKMIFDTEERAFQVMAILRARGGVLTANTTAIRKGFA